MSALVARLAAAFQKNFPERQIYIRSAGEVQFFTFGPLLQASLAGVAVLFLGWAAFATVYVVFKDRSIAAMDYRYDETKLAYDARVSALQHSYAGLRVVLGQSEHDYQLAVDALTNKQKLIGGLLVRESDELAVNSTKTPGTFEAETEADDFTPDFILSQAASTALGRPSDDSTRTPDSSHASDVLAGIRGLFGTLALALRSATLPLFSINSQSADRAQSPGLTVLARQEKRVRALDSAEAAVLGRVEDVFNQHTDDMHDMIRRMGIDPGQFLRKFASIEPL